MNIQEFIQESIRMTSRAVEYKEQIERALNEGYLDANRKGMLIGTSKVLIEQAAKVNEEVAKALSKIDVLRIYETQANAAVDMRDELRETKPQEGRELWELIKKDMFLPDEEVLEKAEDFVKETSEKLTQLQGMEPLFGGEYHDIHQTTVTNLTKALHTLQHEINEVIGLAERLDDLDRFYSDISREMNKEPLYDDVKNFKLEKQQS